jgi:hypothetical protein
MSITAPDYRLLFLRRLDALWQLKPTIDSFWPAKPIFRETWELLGGDYDHEAAGDAMWALITEGLVFAIEIEGDHILQIKPAGREALAELEGKAG